MRFQPREDSSTHLVDFVLVAAGGNGTRADPGGQATLDQFALPVGQTARRQHPAAFHQSRTQVGQPLLRADAAALVVAGSEGALGHPGRELFQALAWSSHGTR